MSVEGTWDIAQFVECLPGMHEALDSIHDIT